MSKKDSNRVDRVLCPFYHRDRTHSINCEGITEGGTIKIFFRTQEDCTIQFETFCSGKFSYCEIYNAIKGAKYADD